jgi:hypothetical protein
VSRKTSLYRGVSKRHGRWKARVKRNGKEVVIGCYPTEVEAARAYDENALRLHGHKAVLNFADSALEMEAEGAEAGADAEGAPAFGGVAAGGAGGDLAAGADGARAAAHQRHHRAAVVNYNAVRLIPADEKHRHADRGAPHGAPHGARRIGPPAPYP